MKLLPDESIRLFTGCAEKINSYLMLAYYNMPVLNSVYLTRSDLVKLSEKNIEKIKKHLNNSDAMLRYIYRGSCYTVKNGGAVVPIKKENIEAEIPADADVWLLEPFSRSDNIWCYNANIDKLRGNLHLEILGDGFDISDLNKGIISAHEIINMPFPLEDGAYGEWWKWAKIYICTEDEYRNSSIIREQRLKELGYSIKLRSKFIPLDLENLEKIRNYIRIIEPWLIESRHELLNISCSVLKSGRFVFWDIQTPDGKIKAYL